MAAETSQTLDRGLRVLEVVAESADGLTVTELASALGIGRTVIYRLVVTLEQHALLRRSPDGKCRLGLGVLAMGRQVQPVVRDTQSFITVQTQFGTGFGRELNKILNKIVEDFFYIPGRGLVSDRQGSRDHHEGDG